MNHSVSSLFRVFLHDLARLARISAVIGKYFPAYSSKTCRFESKAPDPRDYQSMRVNLPYRPYTQGNSFSHIFKMVPSYSEDVILTVYVDPSDFLEAS